MKEMLRGFAFATGIVFVMPTVLILLFAWLGWLVRVFW